VLTVSSHQYILRSLGTVSLPVAASEINGLPVQYRFATAQEMLGTTSTTFIPPQMTLNSDSGYGHLSVVR